ncbi:Transcriptional regulator PadR-like family protein [Amycolatopsis xylanica]|uniref:Transcriptional regulator PadR-like family protein n=1 Tax=Amycolatopsis xylanica TaxID=589385 RepID=A0A1H3E4S8_9PSEU|nr:PadR family transcriptional regulator [Amycolatopsis xylanica]SDX72919.1 Transcriptional regulator PadR-like family protein [Amycolatopsis xylanica]
MAESNPLTPAGFQVLLALAGGKAHGYGIMGFISEVTGGSVQLGPGTLYRTLARLAADGLLEEVPDAREDEPHDARRRYYRLTPQGRERAAQEAALLSRLVAAAGQAGLLDQTGAA